MKKNKSTYSECVEIWFEWYKNQTGIEPLFDGQRGKHLKQMIAYFEKNSTSKNPEWTPQFCFKLIFDNWNKLDVYLQQKKDIPQIRQNFNEILKQIRNGKSTNKQSNAISRIDEMANNAIRNIQRNSM